MFTPGFVRWLTIFAALAVGATLVAQTDNGAIRGTVQDSSGAAVGEATVTATNVATGVRMSTVTAEAGNYNFPQVRAGIYTVEAERTGFKKLIRENVRVEVAGVTGLDLTLEVGGVTESITVSDAAPQLKSESSVVATGVNPKSFLDLPLNAAGGRAPESFIFLAPGTTGDTFNAHINGSQTLSKEIQIEGISMTTAEVGGDPRVLTLPPDAIQEFSLATGVYSAEFGNTGGGIERFTIRSGTNDFHGSAYEFLRNDKLNSRGFFNSSRSVLRQNEYGASIGGPIWIPKVYNGRNRSFFFFNINYYKFRSGAINQIASVPTAAFKRGDLSELKNPDGSLIQLYDPATTRCEGGNCTRDPFPNNQIPANRISSVSRAILGYVPDPTLPGILNNYPATGTSRTDNRNYTMKFDHNFTSSHRISGSWNNGLNADNGPFAPLPHPIANTRASDPGAGQNTVRLSYDWTISPTILNHAGAGFTRQKQLLIAEEQGQGWSEKLGLRGVNNGPFPVVFIAPFTEWGNNQDLLSTISATYAFTDSLSMVVGKHNLKFGVDYRRYQNNFRQGERTGAFTFSRNETAFPTADRRASTGNAFASFLLGTVDNGSLLINEVTRGMRFPYFATYVQDDWKVTSRLTLNLGLRWDLYLPITEVNDNYSIMDPTVPNPAAGGRPGALIFAGEGPGRTGRDRLTNGTSYNNFGPALGLAWSVRPNFVIRTGYQISYYQTGALGGGNAKPPSFGFVANPTFFSQDQGITPAFNWDDGFPQNYQRPPVIDPGFGVGSSTTIWNVSAKEPSYTQSFTFDTQWQLAPSWLLDVGYVGAKATRLSTGVFNVNQVDPQYLRFGELLTRPIDDPAVVAAGFSRPYPGFRGSLAQSLRPFPQYNNVDTNRSENVGNSSYHSLQVKLEKQFSGGLFLLSSYTWSKTLTDSSSALSGFFSTTARDQYNRRLEKALSVFDVPHRVVMAFNYELPIGPGKPIGNVSGAVGKIIGGWQVNGILNYQTGEPIGVGVNNTLPLFNSRNLPNVVPGVDPIAADKSTFDPAKDVLLNRAAFAEPAPFTFGNAASVLPNARTFSLFNEDFGIMKRTFITETANLEFRFEMFNAFNRVRFGGPATNLSDPFNFGRVTSQANQPRTAQFALKFIF
jgi:hypothetical protein